MASDPKNLPTNMFALLLLKKLPAFTMHSASAFLQPSPVPQSGRLPKPAIESPLHTFKMQRAQRRELWSPVMLQMKAFEAQFTSECSRIQSKNNIEADGSEGETPSHVKQGFLLKR